MSPQGSAEKTTPAQAGGPQETAIVKAASAWTARLARTLKNCRLYDGGNPTVLRLREDLAASLIHLLDEHGPLTLRCTSSDIFHGEASLYPARSREDNLGMTFFRDGIRSVIFLPGVEPREVDALVDALLRVTGRTGGEADLVALLWDAELAHVSTESVTTEMPLDGEDGDLAGCDEGSSLMPWPGTGPAAGAGAGYRAPQGDAAIEAGPSRSDDWIAEESPDQSATGLADLEMLGPLELARLRGEYETECATGLLQGALALICECLEAEIEADEPDELGRFLVRLLQEALMVGAWPEAGRAALLLAGRRDGEAAIATLLGELCQPDAVTTSSAIRAVDGQGPGGVQDFLAFARELGPSAVEWLMGILAESRQQRTRLPLARALAELSRDAPERLAPWLSDPRWYVVRNVVHILGRIGGRPVVGLLKSVAGHGDHRVRREVISALSHLEFRDARDVLLEMLDGAETRTFCSVLHQLSCARDPEVARVLLDRLVEDSFQERPAEARRAVYSTLARVAGDEVLPRLEAELYESRWFSADFEAHRLAVARCIARIGGAAAREVLQQGLRSRNRRVRSVCECALAGVQSHE
jgi:HEAT repeat protein